MQALVATTMMAVRLAHPPAMDARADAPVWQTVSAVSDFHQWAPRVGELPSCRTEIRVGYDDRNLYVLVRAFDSHPDSIVRTVTRRDGTSASDEIGIYIDSDGAHRSGYEFFVNAGGSRRDAAISSDVNEDVTWDGVWDAAARVDSLGWTAEFRIPFSQLRFTPGARHAFGFLVNRVIQRRSEQAAWPSYDPNRTGLASQFGILGGLDDIGDGRQVDVAPFTRAVSRGTRATAIGADVRLGLASNVNVNATVLPDFGQVEADPSVVNLTSTETFYPEHRPFFLDGAAQYRVNFNCTAFTCANEGLFYSRRIGRAPQLEGLYGGGSLNDAAPIIAAAKLTGRTDDGTTLAVLAANTGQVSSADGRTLEPGTMYGLARVTRDSRDGQSGASLVATIVERRLDTWSEPFLPRDAMVSGGTFRHRFLGGQYEVSGSATASRVAGTAPAMTSLQTDAVHYFQRPSSGLPLDSTRTSLTGDQEEIAVGKYAGMLMFETAFDRQSTGYEANDLGYLQRADQQTGHVWLGFNTRTPRAFYNRFWANVNRWDGWNAAGMRTEAAANVNAHMLFTSNWQLNSGVTLQHIGSPACDHCARGGPAMRSAPQSQAFVELDGDTRPAIVPILWIPWTVGDGGRSRSVAVNPSVSLRLTSQFQASVGVSLGNNHDNTQWFGSFRDSTGQRYTFAHIDQHTRSVTLRTSYAATPSVSFETYLAPFSSDGVYTDIRALSATPLARNYDDRFASFAPPAGTSTQFGVRQLRGTAVLRWEYAQGSTIFVVWSHERDASETDAATSWETDASQLFGLRPVNTVTVKVSYWMSRPIGR